MSGKIPSLVDLQNTKVRIDHFAELIDGTPSGTSTNPVTGVTHPTYKKAIKDLGFKPASFTFITGGTLGLTDADKCIYNPAPAGDDNWYSWSGTLPHAVAPGTDPTLPGSGYVPRTDVTLRGEITPSVTEALRRSYADAGYTLASGSFEAGGTLTSATDVLLYKSNGKAYSYAGTMPHTVAAGSAPATSGGISPTAWVDRTDLTLRSELESESGYLLVKGIANYVPVSRFVTDNVTGQDALDAAFAYSSANGVEILGDTPLTLTRQISQPPKSKIKWIVDCSISPEFSGGDIYYIDGGFSSPAYSADHTWLLAGKTSMSGFRAYAQNFETGVSAAALTVVNSINTIVDDVVITGANNGGFTIHSGYECKASNINVIVSTNRLAASVGCKVLSSDHSLDNIVPIGYAHGVIISSSANNIKNIHPWGNTDSLSIGSIGKMNWGIELTSNGTNNVLEACYSDTPVRVDTNSVPSRVNGGVGWIVDGWQNTLIGCLNNPHPTSEDSSCISMITTARESTITGYKDSQPAKCLLPFIHFEGTSTPINNYITGGMAEKNISGNYGYHTPSSNFLSSVVFHQNTSYSKSSVSLVIVSATTIKPDTITDILYITLPDYVDTNACRGFTECAQFIYTFRRAITISGKTPIGVIAEVIPASKRVQFRVLYTDGSFSPYLTADYITASGENLSASFTLDIIATNNI